MFFFLPIETMLPQIWTTVNATVGRWMTFEFTIQFISSGSLWLKVSLK